MKELEQNILRYLDGNMSPGEEAAFQEKLRESSEAREMLFQFEQIRSAARLFPSLSQPAADVESLLFQRLFEEEEIEEEEERSPLPFLYRLSSTIRSSAVLVPALLLLLATGTGLLVMQNSPEETISRNEGVVAAVEGMSPVVTPVETDNNGKNTLLRSESATEALALRPQRSAPRAVVTRSAQDKVSPSREIITPQNSDPKPQEETFTPPKVEDTPTYPPYAVISPSSPQTDRTESARQDVLEESSQTPNPSLLAEVPVPLPYPATKRSGRSLTASYRHGMAASVLEDEVMTAQDMSLRIEGHLGKQHRLTLAVGQSPLLVWEQKTEITVSQNEKGARTASVSYNQSNRFDKELWAGVGYGYAVVDDKLVRLEAGVNAGFGEESFRYGLELPASLNLTDNLSLNVVPFISRVAPYDQQIHEVKELEEEQRLDFTTFGAQVGIAFSIGK